MKNEEPADDDVEAKILKGLIWNSTPSKDVRSQVESSSTNVFTIPDQVIDIRKSGIGAMYAKWK
eukprot:8512638-Ditylum_brightwellii.AAC.1